MTHLKTLPSGSPSSKHLLHIRERRIPSRVPNFHPQRATIRDSAVDVHREKLSRNGPPLAGKALIRSDSSKSLPGRTIKISRKRRRTVSWHPIIWTIPHSSRSRGQVARGEKSISSRPDERDTKVFGALAVALGSLERLGRPRERRSLSHSGPRSG